MPFNSNFHSSYIMKKDLMLTVIQKRWVLLCLFIILCFFGYYSWKQLSIEAYPDIADVTSQVVTQVPGLAAEEVEQQITIPLERALNGLPGMHVMRSKSTFGLSMITIVFEDGTEDYWSRQRVQERLDEVELPYDAVPGLDPLTSPTGEIYRYIIESDKHSLRELTDLQNWVIIPRIKQVSGVTDVSNFGGITTQYQVEIDPQKLEQYHISLDQVMEAIENNNSNVGGSVLNRGDLGYVVRGIGLISDLEDLGKIVVSSENGVPVFLNDIGKLKYGNLERKGVFGYTDRKREYSESIEGIVLLLKHENPSIVLEGIKNAVDELNSETLPEGVNIHVFLDRTQLVDTTLHTVSRTLLEGMILVIIVLIVFLGSWRGALLVAVTIPISLLIAFILMHLTNIPANLLSLGAIDFGIIVDGAIVMMETILKKREDHPQEYLEEKSISKRVIEVAKPIAFATIIIITAYLPLFAFERVERKLFTPMAFTVSYALIGALLVALFLIPGIGYALYRKPKKIYHNKWLEKLTLKYSDAVSKILKKPKKVIVSVAVIFVCAIGLSVFVGKDFLPVLDEGSIWMQVNLPPGISVEKSRELSDTLRQRTMKHGEVTYIAVQAGRNDDGTDPFTPSHFEVSIGIKPYSEWPSGKTKNDLIDELAKEYESLAGFRVGFSQPMIDGVMDKIAGAHSELVIKVYGDEFKETRRIAEDIMNTLKNVEGAVDLDIDQEPPLPQLQVHMNRDAIARYGLNVSDVSNLIEVAIGGKAISQIYQNDRVYDITCKYDENSRNTPEKIAALMLTSATGAKIPLSQVADIKLSTGESTITREMNKRHLTVKLNLRGRDLGSFLEDAQHSIEKKYKIRPRKISYKVGRTV
jgi:cobalt-zinc-cadmium resistance protein CzcA